MAKESITLNVVAYNSLITPTVGMSGGDRIFLELVKKLPVFGVKINLFTARNVDEFLTENNVKNVSIHLLSNIRFSVYKNLFWNSLAKTFLSIKYVLNYKYQKSPKLFIYSASDFWPDVIPAFIMKLKNKQSIWVASFYQFAPAPWQKESPYKGKASLRGLVYWLMQQPVYWLVRNFAEIVFVTSEPDVSLFPEHKKRGDYFVVKGGVDVGPSAEYLHRGISSKKCYEACFIGRLHPQKGVMELIDIWRMVINKKSNAKLALIGNGPLKEELVNKIRKSNLESKIDLLGFRDGEDKYRVFRESKMVLHPATYDSGGMAAAEAMAWGLPGISFDLESLKTYYPKGMIKVKIGDLKSFSETILKLIENENLRKQLGEEALNLINSQWSWDKRVSEIYSFIQAKIS